MMTQKEEIGFYSIGINVLLVILKGGLAVLSGSVALVADAIHSATDVDFFHHGPGRYQNQQT